MGFGREDPAALKQPVDRMLRLGVSTEMVDIGTAAVYREFLNGNDEPRR